MSYSLVSYKSKTEQALLHNKFMCAGPCNICPANQYTSDFMNKCQVHPDEWEECKRCGIEYCFFHYPEHPKECRTGKKIVRHSLEYIQKKKQRSQYKVPSWMQLRDIE